MNNGKHICKKLKTIRKQIAEANDIEYEPNVCTHKGDCAGTCPACEAETQYIESQLIKRRRLGKAVSVIGISTTLALGVAAGGLTSCALHVQGKLEPNGKMEKVNTKPQRLAGDVDVSVTDGVIARPYEEEGTDSAKSSQPDSASQKTYFIMSEETE